jgi:hypothetical protein
VLAVQTWKVAQKLAVTNLTIEPCMAWRGNHVRKPRSTWPLSDFINAVQSWQAHVSTFNPWRTRVMPAIESPSVVTLETQITERYGLLQSLTQQAELLGRCIYYPTTEVAGLIKGTSNE